MNGRDLWKFCRGMFVVSIFGGAGLGSVSEAKSPCLAGSLPSAYMAVASVGAEAPSPGASLNVRQFPEAFVICTPSHSSGRLTELIIEQIRKGGRDLARDADPAVVSFERFRGKGFSSWRESSVYGKILTSQFLCPGCDLEDEQHRAKLRLLREFSIWGSNRSDYREIPVLLYFDRNRGRYLMSHAGEAVQLVVHYPWKWGVEKVVTAECRSGDPEQCLGGKSSSMVVTRVLHLESQPAVKIQSQR